MRRIILALLLLIPFIRGQLPARETEVDRIPEDVHRVDSNGLRTVFDFIVVGAGASGSIVATRYEVKNYREEINRVRDVNLYILIFIFRNNQIS
jgi:hypothetical protein